MASYIGQVGEFDKEKEDVEAYAERFEQFIEANSVTDDKKIRAIFLSTIGAQSYKLLRTLSGNEPAKKSYEELKKLIIAHLKPRPNVISQRYRFFKRDRVSGETVSEYVAALRDLSEFCDFKTELDNYIRDRFVCGINDQKILQKLLSTKELTLEAAIQSAIAIEAACKDSKLIHGAIEGQVSGGAAVMKLGSAGYGGGKTRCFRCGDGRHLADKCPFKSKICYACKKPGHLKKVCREGKQGDGNPRNTNHVEVESAPVTEVGEEEDADYLELSALSLYMLQEPGREPILVPVVINDKEELYMEVDTGAAVSVMSRTTYDRVKDGNDKLKTTKMKLRTYTGEMVSPVGVGNIRVSLQGQHSVLPVTVVEGNVPALIGRNWLQTLKLDWNSLFPTATAAVHKCGSTTERSTGESRSAAEIHRIDVEVQKLVREFPEVFTDKLGCFKGYKVKIPVADDVVPKYYKPRPVPYALQSRVEEELDKLEEQGVWEKVAYSKWAAPIVTVLKDPKEPQGALRICGDYKLTVNKVAPLDNYPVPSVNDQLATLQGGVYFSKLDLSQAYQQLELDEDTRELLTISTHRGLYRPFRLQFGVHSATGIFQRTMEQVLAGIPHVKVRVDDILVSGRTLEECLRNLRKVLAALSRAGFTVKWSKCAFLQEEVVYCGHYISAEGIRPVSSNVEAIQKAPAPTNISEVKAFLGMVNYYNSFIPNLSTITEPLHALLRKDAVWKWTAECDGAFQRLKEILSSEPVLTHFDPKRSIYVHCDASPYGVGAVLSNVMKDGVEKPVSYGSRTLSVAERNYGHVEKEGLSLVYATRKFHQYLYGQRFTLVTDHKPLLGLFGENHGLPSRSSARVLRWALMLSAYDYRLEYRPGKDHGNADALSRLPLQLKPGEATTSVVSVRLLDVEMSPVTEEEVRTATRRNPVMSKLLNVILQGWGGVHDPELKDYRLHAAELTTEGGCVLWGSRVVIPRVLQEKVLRMLHEMHPGMSRMKALARSYVWWPRIDADIESAVRSCTACQENQSKPAGAPVHPWEHPGRPWQRLHIDHAGPMQGRLFLVVVDAYSRWLEVEKVASTSSAETIRMLRRMFSTHGLPEVVVSDNGTSFSSLEFENFMRRNGIRSVKTAPYHPSSNGPVERYVQTFKRMLKTAEGDQVEEKLARILFQYRTTPHTVSGQSPAELLMKRKLRTRLDVMRPDPGRDRRPARIEDVAKLRQFQPGEDVLAVNFSKQGGRWIGGCVVRRLGSTNYEIRLPGGEIIHRHIDQLVAASGPVAEVCRPGEVLEGLDEIPMKEGVVPSPEAVETPVPAQPVTMPEEPAMVPEPVPVPEVVAVSAPPSACTPAKQEVRRSARNRKAPVYLDSYVPK